MVELELEETKMVYGGIGVEGYRQYYRILGFAGVAFDSLTALFVAVSGFLGEGKGNGKWSENSVSGGQYGIKIAGTVCAGIAATVLLLRSIEKIKMQDAVRLNEAV